MNKQNNLIKQQARNLRKNQTPSEQVVWEIVRNRRLKGKRFLRQHVLRFEYEGKRRVFFTDFYCPELHLAVEIDGSIHQNQLEYDELRTFIINQMGIKVIRIKNEELLNAATAAMTKLNQALGD